MNDQIRHYSYRTCAECGRVWELAECGPEPPYDLQSRIVRVEHLREQGAADLGTVEICAMLGPWPRVRGGLTPERIAIATQARLAGDTWRQIAQVLDVRPENAQQYVEHGMSALERRFGSAAAAWRSRALEQHPASEPHFCPFCGMVLPESATSLNPI